MTKGTAIRNTCAIAGAVLIAYVASSGPVLAYAWLKDKDPETIDRFYDPLWRLIQTSPTINRAYQSYIAFSADLWMRCGLKTVYSIQDEVK